MPFCRHGIYSRSVYTIYIDIDIEMHGCMWRERSPCITQTLQICIYIFGAFLSINAYWMQNSALHASHNLPNKMKWNEICRCIMVSSRLVSSHTIATQNHKQHETKPNLKSFYKRNSLGRILKPNLMSLSSNIVLRFQRGKKKREEKRIKYVNMTEKALA